jgi:hypothetical protein
VDHKSLQQLVLILEVTVLGKGVGLVALDALLLEDGVLDEVDVSE